MKNRADIESVDNEVTRKEGKGEKRTTEAESVLASGQQTGYGCGRSAVDKP